MPGHTELLIPQQPQVFLFLDILDILDTRLWPWWLPHGVLALVSRPHSLQWDEGSSVLGLLANSPDQWPGRGNIDTLQQQWGPPPRPWIYQVFSKPSSHALITLPLPRGPERCVREDEDGLSSVRVLLAAGMLTQGCLCLLPERGGPHLGGCCFLQLELFHFFPLFLIVYPV